MTSDEKFAIVKKIETDTAEKEATQKEQEIIKKKQ